MAKVVNGYKVVRPREKDGRKQLLSAMVYDLDWVVAYVPGIPAYGHGKSALFGFDSLAHAKQFSSDLAPCQIWAAHLGRPKLRKRLCAWVQNYLKFWSGNRKGRTFQAPEGTMACESITLLKQVA